ncbi:2-oxoglutarate dehydrogenase complex dihydrolipoyllysine-residue succinyltransferase [Bdellovibrionota bacterium FG-1]
MQHNVVAPSVGESITEVSILKWAKADGALVKPGDLLLEIESDKATVELVSEYSGKLSITRQAGERIPIGAVLGMIDDSVVGSTEASKPASAQASTPAPAAHLSNATPGPAARKTAADLGYPISQIPGTGKDGRVTKGDVLGYTAPAAATPVAPIPSQIKDRPGDRRVPMSNLRARIAERLVQAQHTAAILTTFNEVDMSAILELRNKNKDAFKAKHGVSLGFMSFFTRACVEAFKEVPDVNGSIDGRDAIYHDYVDMGIAVGTERGLVVPIIKDAHKMNFVDIEKKIAELAIKARDGKLSIADLSGGTFTISNGGVYGSLLSTPILTPPQSGILGMHKTQERPVVVEKDGKKTIEIRPMMYLALSYDHRLIDGKGAVTFLVKVKENLENPIKMGFEF